MIFTKKRLQVLIGLTSLTLFCVTPQARAAGFQIYEVNGAGVGNFDAGFAAEAADASTAYTNPAGLVMLDHPQIVVGAAGVQADVIFKGSVANYSQVNLPGFLGGGSVVLPASYEEGSANGGEFAVLPSMHIAIPLNDRLFFGFSIVVPFGLETDYSDDSILRYAGTDTRISDVDITPSLAFKFTDKLSVGVGIDVQHIDAEFDQVVGLGQLSGGIPGIGGSGFRQPDGSPYPSTNTATDTISENHAQDWAVGWHGGILYQFSENTRVGLTYHSKLHVDASGTSRLKGPLAAIATGSDGNIADGSSVYKNSDLKSKVDLPDTISLGIFHALDYHWQVMGTVNYTRWSEFKDIPLYNVAGVSQRATGGIFNFMNVLDPSTLDINVPQNFHNSWRIAVGLNYRVNDEWLIRLGGGWDQTPVNDRDVNVRLPDQDRFDVAIGAHYQPNKKLGIDVGWTHIFADPRDLDYTTQVGQQITRVNGEVTNNANIYGLQLSWTFA